MHLKVNDQYSIEADQYQYILVEHKEILSGPKKGQIRKFNIGFYSDIKNAIKACIRRNIRLSGHQTFADILEHLNHLEQNIINMTADIKL